MLQDKQATADFVRIAWVNVEGHYTGGRTGVATTRQAADYHSNDVVALHCETLVVVGNGHHDVASLWRWRNHPICGELADVTNVSFLVFGHLDLGFVSGANDKDQAREEENIDDTTDDLRALPASDLFSLIVALLFRFICPANGSVLKKTSSQGASFPWLPKLACLEVAHTSESASSHILASPAGASANEE